MGILGTVRQRCSRAFAWGGSLSFAVSLGLTLSWGSVVRAASPDTAPPEVTNILRQIETAANSRSLEAVMDYYSPDFTNSDNLNRSDFSEALSQLWERYPQLDYRTELQEWETRDGGLITETVTYITGVRKNGGQGIKLEATVRSRQLIENNKIVRQEILSERSQLSVGNNPPEVRVNLPERVRPGERYNFDAIVTEPLGEDLLLGAALEEKIEGERYLEPGAFDLELLQAGGLFKVGRAPEEEDNHWVSAILIRGDGMTVITQRLQVGEQSSVLGSGR
ncbi:nuclear transport factor 2 family protein [Lusitaniella coriacea]|uniref:nuclear transport factor 2 family protein n=1 Tax=Lusitaniella coriacea TaxID=1983105 RepID=UPI003CEA7FCF